jgi:hypothetical protein
MSVLPITIPITIIIIIRSGDRKIILSQIPGQLNPPLFLYTT